MGSQDKRARQKERRDAAQAARAAELRRRRNARLVGAGVVIALLVVAGIVYGSGDDEGGGGGGGDAGSRSPGEPAVACDGERPPEATPAQYDSPPEMALEDGVDYSAVIHTSCGDITMDLLERDAPVTVNNFVFLAREGYYDGLIWHRVERNVVIQTGDPNGRNGTPPDGPGYSIEDENLPKSRDAYYYGDVGMANSGPDTGGSQFFIVLQPEGPAGYNPFYSVFAEVDRSSRATLQAIGRLETDESLPPPQNVLPLTPVYIESIDILER